MSTVEELREEYFTLVHAMQSGVKMEMELGASKSAEPKHLRVGVNAAMSDHGGLVKLLMDKGLFTEEEYFTYMRDFMKREVEGYEKRLSAHLGHDIHLA
jgi:hypothetical protein